MDHEHTGDVDPQSLLVRTMTHDLLAPLTAIKWQVELLARPATTEQKRAAYTDGIAQAAALGIALTKRVHLANLVLSGDYVLQASSEQQDLGMLCTMAVHELEPQFVRHGVHVSQEWKQTASAGNVDQEITGLLIWSLAKFIMTCAQAGSTVMVRGSMIPASEGSGYEVVFSIPLFPEVDRYERAFSGSSHDGFDEAAVFARIARMTAPLVRAQVDTERIQDMFCVRVQFLSEDE